MDCLEKKQIRFSPYLVQQNKCQMHLKVNVFFKETIRKNNLEENIGHILEWEKTKQTTS